MKKAPSISSSAELLLSPLRGKTFNWGKLRGKGVLQELRIQLFTVKQDDIKEKARENTMFSLAFLGAEERI